MAFCTMKKERKEDRRVGEWVSVLEGDKIKKVFYSFVILIQEGASLFTTTAQPVWPDLAKCRHLGKKVENFGNF